MIKKSRNVLLLGASGYIGHHVEKKLLELGYNLICTTRKKTETFALHQRDHLNSKFYLDWNDKESANDFFKACPKFDVVISCIASRSGGIKDSWNIDFNANKTVLNLAIEKNAKQFIFLSAICVQKPKLAFQKAKKAFEDELIKSPIAYTIIRPTAFFKSISGQVKRIKKGKKFVLFGSGELTCCKPISESDMADFICDSIDNVYRMNRLLPIGGPGSALTPKQQAKILFKVARKPEKYVRIPAALFPLVNTILFPFSLIFSNLVDKREFLKIAYYYATESMIVWDSSRKTYDAEATPEYGSENLETFYKEMMHEGTSGQEMGQNRLF